MLLSPHLCCTIPSLLFRIDADRKVRSTASGLPVPHYFWHDTTKEKLLNGDGVIIAQVASLSMEFIRLSQVTGDSKYASLIQTVTDQLARTQNFTDLPGMWPLTANCSGDYLSFQDKRFSLGVLAGECFSIGTLHDRLVLTGS
jgi:mannosyl-oligosaccharide alpha-1,2-mannosidase